MKISIKILTFNNVTPLCIGLYSLYLPVAGPGFDLGAGGRGA